MAKQIGSPKLGGNKRRGFTEPSLSKDWKEVQRRLELGLATGDVAPIIEMGATAVPHLIAVVRDTSRTRWERLHAALALGEIRDESAVQPLGEVLRHEVSQRDSEMLVLEVADALRKINTPQALNMVQQTGL